MKQSGTTTISIVYPRRGAGVDDGVTYSLSSMLRTQAKDETLAAVTTVKSAAIAVLVPRHAMLAAPSAVHHVGATMSMPMPASITENITASHPTSAFDFGAVCERFFAHTVAGEESSPWHCAAGSAGVIVGVVVHWKGEALPLSWELTGAVVQCAALHQLCSFADAAARTHVDLVPPGLATPEHPVSAPQLWSLLGDSSRIGDKDAPSLKLVVSPSSAPEAPSKTTRSQLPMCTVVVKRVFDGASGAGEASAIPFPTLDIQWDSTWARLLPQTQSGEADDNNSSSSASESGDNDEADDDTNKQIDTKRSAARGSPFDALRHLQVSWDQCSIEVARGGRLLLRVPWNNGDRRAYFWVRELSLEK